MRRRVGRVRARLASLTARLVLTAVALVVAVSVLVGVAATLAMHDRLTEQLDDQVRDAAFGVGGPGGGNTRPDTLVLERDGDGSPRVAYLAGRGPDENQALPDDVVAALADVEPSRTVRAVDLPGLGTYRVQVLAARDGSERELVVGLPTREVDAAVSSLVVYEVAFVALGGVLAAGAALLLVRRRLRPLTEVAETAHVVSELPLSEGEIHLTERVPDHLTDEATEVGQVGAALNRLLQHVETSLAARHRSEQQVRQFVADASHELRTPLATIVGYTELARRRPDEATRTTALAKVEEESGRMRSLVEDLLLLARLDADQPLAHERVDLTRLLLEAVADAQVVGPEHHWRLELAEDAVEVTGDEQRLHQVVTNLLTNARRHTPPGTTVTVSTLAPDPGIDARTGPGLEVRDDGPGFSPGLAAVAFERFARGDAARQRTGGAGLGLALVQAITTSLGGTVALDSRPGDTRITVRLPPAPPG